MRVQFLSWHGRDPGEIIAFSIPFLRAIPLCGRVGGWVGFCVPHSAFSGQVQLAKLNCLKPIFAILEKPQEEKGHATDPRMKFFGLACLSNLTSKNNHVENMIVQEGGLEVLFQLMKSPYPNIPAEAAKVVTNLAVQNEENQVHVYLFAPRRDPDSHPYNPRAHQMNIVDLGGLDHLLPLSKSESEACQYQASCALLNILQHSSAKVQIFESGGLEHVQLLLSSEKNEIQRKAS